VISIFGCSPKIMSIVEYKKTENSLTKSRLAKFDRNGNKVMQRAYGNQRSNRIVEYKYQKGKKYLEIRCDYFEKQDTCVVRDFSEFQYNENEKLKIQTLYESDSAVRIIRKHQRFGNLEIIKINTWEMFPSKNPDLKKAMKLTDSIFYDSKDRISEERHYNDDFKEPWMEKYQYSKDGYSKEFSGTRNDTIIYFNYSPLEKLAKRKNIDFNFRDTLNYKCEIIYY
jgi:hypothetical protein